jgi:hypothetical protein
MNNQEINLEEESTIMADEARARWDNKVESLLLGKTISFRGMLWESKGHSWEDFTVKVAAIRPNNSGNPFYSEVHILSDEGKNYTILASEKITIQ